MADYLPKGFTHEGPFKVLEVKDGDMFVLENGKKVRLLGVDTPESGSPFADEATEFTKKCIAQKDVILGYAPKGVNRDKFGRKLCIVLYQHNEGGKKECLNAELIRKGLAHVYAFKSTPKSLITKLRDLQRKARLAKLNTGIWRDFQDVDVVATDFRFHRDNCKGIGKSKVSKKKASDAFDEGLSPCRNCLNTSQAIHATKKKKRTVDKFVEHPSGGLARQKN